MLTSRLATYSQKEKKTMEPNTIEGEELNLFFLISLTIASQMLAELLEGEPEEILEAIQEQANQIIKNMEEGEYKEIMETLPSLIKTKE
jgi:NifU-like protein involved in Fe-S cluster formation